MRQQRPPTARWIEDWDRTANGELRAALQGLLEHREELARQQRSSHDPTESDLTEEIESFKEILELYRRLHNDDHPEH